MAVTADRPGPYAPAKTVLEIIGRYRSRGLPAPINAEVLERAGVSDSLRPRTLQTLQALDLIDENGSPTQVFEGIRLAPETEYKKRLEDWLKGAYADVFAFVDPTQDGSDRIRDAFRAYNPIGQQDRMVSLFEGLATAAGLISEKPAAARVPQPKAGGLRRALAPVLKKPASTTSLSAPATLSGLPPALAGLMQSIPSPEAGWPDKATHDAFLATFATVLDFCIPIAKPKQAIPIDEEDTDGDD